MDLFRFDQLLALVEAAARAGAMGGLGFAALGANGDSWMGEVIVCSPFVSAGF